MKTNIFKNSRTKKIITLLIFFVSLSLYSISQKIDKQDLLFDYIKMPAEPLNKSIKNFSSNVILAYEADIIAKEKAAQDELSKIIGLEPSKKEERAVEELRNLLKDQKTRWEANNK